MKKIMIIGLLLATSSVMAQKNMTTNAAMVWKSYQSNMAAKNIDGAESDLVEAIGFITKAADHESTKNDAKTLMYKGKIYCEASKMGMTAKNEELKAYGNEETLEKGLAAFEKSAKNDSKGRYEDDIADYCQLIRSQSNNIGVQAFENKDFTKSMNAFLSSAKFGKAMGLTDTVTMYYGGIAAINAEEYENAIKAFSATSKLGFEVAASAQYLGTAYSKLDRSDEGEKVLSELLKNNPGNKDVMVSLINVYLGSDKKVEAEKVLTDAIALSPKSKELHFTVGTVYEEQERYQDAEKAYKKVLEIDPEYDKALLRLGAVYFNKAATINGKINELALGDPKEAEYRSEMTESFKNAIPYLEKANELTPNDKEILGSLRQAYYKTGNAEKAAEIKAIIDGLK
ncbi:MAG: tetratricopeptide repeat protein [Crocinitomicaceae bacterium]